MCIIGEVNRMHTLCSQLGTIRTSKCVIDEPLELVVASSLCKMSLNLSFPRGAQESGGLLQRFVV